MNLLVLLNSLVMVFLMIMVGFAVGRSGFVNTSAQKEFSAFVLNVSLPCTILNSMLREMDTALIRDAVLIFVLTLVIYGASLFLNEYTARLFRVPKEKQPVWNVCVSLCNCGFMGFPVVYAVLGADGLFLAAIMNVAYNLVALTYGVTVISRNSGGKETMSLRRILLTPANLAAFIGLFFFCTQIPMPETIGNVIGHFSNITTPLSMFLVGFSLSRGSLLQVVKDRHVWTVTLMRLLLTPLVVLFILRLLPLDDLLVSVTVLLAAMPCATYSVILATKYDEDVALASKATFLTSLMCIMTIPVVMMVVGR